MNKYNPNIHHRRSIRLKGYDYSKAGLYFITICCHNRICRFGEIINGEMALNEFGRIAYDEWIKTPTIRNNVELDVFVIMPNHIHGIIILNNHRSRGESHSPESHSPESHSPESHCEPYSPDLFKIHQPDSNESPSNEIDMGVFGEYDMGVFGEYDIGVFDEYNGAVCDTPLRSPSNNVGAIVRGYKSAVTKQIHLINDKIIVWQRNYHEQLIRNECVHNAIREYIIKNPLKWKDDRMH